MIDGYSDRNSDCRSTWCSDGSNEQRKKCLVGSPLDIFENNFMQGTHSLTQGNYFSGMPRGGLIVGEDKKAHVSFMQLDFLSRELPPRDLDVLLDIEARRYMTSGQVCRLRFGTASTPGSAQRIANRVLNRLKGHGLIVPLQRRIGGVRGGSSEYIWALTPAGYRLLHLEEDDLTRKLNFEPSQRFAEHTLAVTELDMQLRSIQGVSVMEAQFEPDNWRDCGKNRLKPDYYAITSVGEYEDYWFFEIDLATVKPFRVVEKCMQYQEYYYSGVEQHKTGIFPRVVWVAPDKKRQEDLRRYIREGKTIQLKDLFVVITMDELEHLIREGVTP